MQLGTTLLPSPNCDSRDTHAIDMLVLHYTGMKDGPRALARLIDPASEVSAHYVVEEDGCIFSLVDESMRAWHAGLSYWRGHTNINQRSIGIEIVNPGHEFGYPPFPDIQMHAVIALCQDILSRHTIPARNVVGHSDIAPTRKQDPGELFNWAWLAKEGIGLHISKFDVDTRSEPVGEPALSASEASSPCESQETFTGQNKKLVDRAPVHRSSKSEGGSPEALKKFGYDVTEPKAAITAFKRHFRPDNINDEWDEACSLTLAHLLNNTNE